MPDDRPESVPPAPIRLAWADADRHILGHPALGRSPAVVCVAGPVGSGKTTLAARLAASGATLVISTDDYLPDYDATPDHLRDEPDSAHLPELAGHLADLLAGRPADLPLWSFHTHRRAGVRRADPAPLIVVEGIHALHPALDAVRSLGVLVHAARSVRWARWEALESSGQRGWGVERARAFFENVADPTFDRHRPVYLSRADLLVVNDS